MMLRIKYQNLWMMYFFFPIWFPGLKMTLIGPCFLVEACTEMESSFICMRLSSWLCRKLTHIKSLDWSLIYWSPFIFLTNHYWALWSCHQLELIFELEGWGLNPKPMLQTSLLESCWQFWTHIWLIINQHLISHLELLPEFIAASGTSQGREMSLSRPVQAFPQALHKA